MTGNLKKLPLWELLWALHGRPNWLPIHAGVVMYPFRTRYGFLLLWVIASYLWLFLFNEVFICFVILLKRVQICTSVTSKALELAYQLYAWFSSVVDTWHKSLIPFAVGLGLSFDTRKSTITFVGMCIPLFFRRSYHFFWC